tara:strand:+ start:49 stop:489 length:441 start_codon:yes stop_codon:yes gene_type:complete
MAKKKEAVETVIKGGKKLDIFQKIYKQLLKFKSPKEAKEAAEKAFKEKKDEIINKKVADSAKVIKKTKKIAKIGGAGLAGVDVGGYALTGESPIAGPIVKKIIGKKDGGMVKMKRGGSVKKRAKSSSKKSRGTGAAIKGTKFKGVF